MITAPTPAHHLQPASFSHPRLRSACVPRTGNPSAAIDYRLYVASLSTGHCRPAHPFCAAGGSIFLTHSTLDNSREETGQFPWKHPHGITLSGSPPRHQPCSPVLRCWWVNLPDKQPVVDVAQGVRHVGRCLIMHPFAINYKLVLVVPAGGDGVCATQMQCPLSESAQQQPRDGTGGGGGILMQEHTVSVSSLSLIAYSCIHLPPTTNLYWWYLHSSRGQG
jgi:hypothetical protein